MKMKTFKADSMQEALAQVKEELGPEAVILKTKKSTRRILGRNREVVEVTAALDESLYAKPRQETRQDDGRKEAKRETEAAPPKTYDWRGRLPVVKEGTVTDPAAPTPRNTPKEAVPEPAIMDWIRTELKQVRESVEMPTRELQILRGEIKDMLAAVNSSRSETPAVESPAPALLPLPLHMETLNEVMLAIDMDPGLARQAMTQLSEALPPSQVRDPHKAGPWLQKWLARSIRVTQGLRRRKGRPSVCMLVGPTGVGKTTTIAKLAAKAQFELGLKAAILSADGHRMGADEHLKVFGEATGIPVRTVFDAADARDALRSFAHCDFIFVDTAGRNHRKPEAWEELRTLVLAVQPDEIHLTLSCTTRLKELQRMAEQYQALGASSLIFTKLDECLGLGCIPSLSGTVLPVSFLCNGQAIPQDIFPATAEGAASLVLDGIFAMMEAREHATV